MTYGMELPAIPARKDETPNMGQAETRFESVDFGFVEFKSSDIGLLDARDRE